MTGATPIEKPINNVVSKNCVYIIIVIEATPFTPNKWKQSHSSACGSLHGEIP